MPNPNNNSSGSGDTKGEPRAPNDKSIQTSTATTGNDEDELDVTKIADEQFPREDRETKGSSAVPNDEGDETNGALDIAEIAKIAEILNRGSYDTTSIPDGHEAGHDAGLAEEMASAIISEAAALGDAKTRGLSKEELEAEVIAMGNARDTEEMVNESMPGAYAQGGSSTLELSASETELSFTQELQHLEEARPSDAVEQDLSGLVVANPVSEENVRQNLNLPVAEQVGGDQAVEEGTDREHDRHKSLLQTVPFRTVGLALGFLAIVGIILAVLLLRRDSDAKNAEFGGSSTALAFARTKVLSLLPDDTKTSLEDPNSPQSLAFQFILADPGLPLYEDWRTRQRFALATLFYATGGPDWKKSDNWLSLSHHECDWFAQKSPGITIGAMKVTDHPFPCEDAPNGIYKHLWLWSNGLKGTLPLEIFWLTGLKSISVYFNDLRGTLPSNIGLLSHLEGLNMAAANLTGTLPSEVGLLAKLRAMVVMDNKLEGTMPLDLVKPSSLTLMALNSNHFSGTIPTEFGIIGNMKGLWLADNALTGKVPSQLGLLTLAQVLDLSWNNLLSSIPSELGQLSLVERMFLSRNNFVGAIPSELGALSKVTRLELNDNLFSMTVPTELGNLVSLLKWSVERNVLSGPLPSELGRLTAVKYMGLNDNQLSGSIPWQIAILDSLVELNVSGNPLLSGSFPSRLCSIGELSFDCSISLCGCDCICGKEAEETVGHDGSAGTNGTAIP